MLIPILHFEGNCTDAIALYEKAFNTKAENYDMMMTTGFVMLR